MPRPVDVRESLRIHIRLLLSRVFSDLQGSRTTRSKTYDTNLLEEDVPDREDHGSEKAFAAYEMAELADFDVDNDYVEAMAASEDTDATQILSFENEFEDLCQEVPEVPELQQLPGRPDPLEGEGQEPWLLARSWPIKGIQVQRVCEGQVKGKRDAHKDRPADCPLELQALWGAWTLEVRVSQESQLLFLRSTTVALADLEQDELYEMPPAEAMSVIPEACVSFTQTTPEGLLGKTEPLQVRPTCLQQIRCP